MNPAAAPAAPAPAPPPAPPPAAVRVPGLDELVAMLRRAELPVGASEALDAAQLLQMLATRVDGSAQQRDALKTLLRPVLCKRQADLERFDRTFDAWAQLPPLGAPPAALELRSQRADGAGAAGADDGAEAPARGTFWRRQRWNIVALGAVAALVAAAWWSGREEAATPQEAAPVAAPAPAASAAAPLPLPEARDLPSLGYFPRLRANVELQPHALLALVVLAVLGLAPLLLAARELPRLTRGRGTARVHLAPWPAGKALAHLVPGLPPPTEGLLQRHVRGTAEEVRAFARRPQLDLRRTVAATLERGLPTPRYRFARLRPAFLVLAEADGDEDVRLLWTQRLLALDARVEIFRLEPAPGATDLFARAPVCVEVGGRGRRLAFDALPNPPLGQRLVICARLALMFERGRRRRSYVTAARLERWRERALFTHDEYGLWDPEQVDELETARPGDPGMFVFPLDDNALEAWGQWLRHGQLPPITLSEPINYPPSLSESEDDFCGDADLARDRGGVEAAERLRRLLAELHEYLGSNGLYWLAACAVPPVLERRLALLLGEEYFRRTGAGERAVRHYMALNWMRLTRLPWFREPPRQMPPWLRLALLERLPRLVQDELRALVVAALDRKALDRSVPAADERHALPLGFDAPGAPPGPAAPRDLLYIGFVRQGLDADQLALRLPGHWRAWLPRVLDRQPITARLMALGARLLRAGGVRGSGLSPTALGLSAGVLALALALGAVMATLDPDLLPAPWRGWLVVERMRQVQTHGEESVGTAAISPDGRWLATGGEWWRGGSGVTLWDTGTGLAVQRLAGEVEVRALAWSSDGRRLAVSGYDRGRSDGRIEIHAPAGDAAPVRLRDVDVWPSELRFSADRTRLVANGSRFGGDVREWSVDDGRLLARDPAPPPQQQPPRLRRDEVVNSLAEDGSLLAEAVAPDRVQLRDIAGAAVWKTEPQLNGPVRQLAVHAATRRVAALVADGTLVVIGPGPDDRVQRRLMVVDDVPRSGVAFSPDGSRLFVRVQGRALVLQTRTLEGIGANLDHLGMQPEAATFSADNRLLAAQEPVGQVTLWSSAAAVPSAERLGPAATPIARAVPVGTGDWLVTEPAAGPVQSWRLWQRGTEAWLRRGTITVVAPREIVVPGTPFVRVRADGLIVFDPVGDTTVSLPAPLPGLTPLAAAPADEGRSVVVVAQDGRNLRIARASLRDGAVTATADIPGPFERTYLSGDGRWLAVWSAAGGLRTFDAHNGRLRSAGSWTTAPTALYWHGELRAALDGARIELARDGDKDMRQLRHGAPVRRAAFSPDGKRLASVADDGALRVWSTEDGVLLGVPLIAGQALNHVAWMPDGVRLVVSVGGVGPAQAGELVSPLSGFAATPAQRALKAGSPPAVAPPAVAASAVVAGGATLDGIEASGGAAAGAEDTSTTVDLDREWPLARPGAYLVHAPPLQLDALQHGLAWTRQNVLAGTGIGGVLSTLFVVLPVLAWALWRARRGATRLWRGVADPQGAG